jgi:hypothetical protein
MLFSLRKNIIPRACGCYIITRMIVSQVYRHRENQLQTRAMHLEETILEQNQTIMSLSPRSGAKDQVPLVNSHYQFIKISIKCRNRRSVSN